jgi:hypothetical protein
MASFGFVSAGRSLTEGTFGFDPTLAAELRFSSRC